MLIGCHKTLVMNYHGYEVNVPQEQRSHVYLVTQALVWLGMEQFGLAQSGSALCTRI
jgi:hypothetical protein